MNVLLHFMNVSADSTKREHIIALRQLTIRSVGEKSWFIYVQQILWKYNLCSAHMILSNPPGKEEWKRTVKKAIHGHWETKMWEEAQTKKSLKWLSRECFKVGNPLPIWSEATSSTQEARKALPKVWLLTGTYYLQSKVHKWKGRDGDTTCKLCQQAPEDETHFLLECESTQHVRQPYLDDLKNTLGQYQHEIFNDKKLLTLCVLNSIHPEIPQNVSKCLRTSYLEYITRNWIYALHI